MKKVRFGIPEAFVPTKYCRGLVCKETEIRYDTSRIRFKTTQRGCVLELPLKFEEQIYGFGLQLGGFNHKNHKLTLRVNSDPVANTGDSHAPVPFFVTNMGYGIYIDTARYIEVHCGYAKKRRRDDAPDNTVIATAADLYKKSGLCEDTVMSIEIPVAKGVDTYIFEGKTITDIVAQYNMFSGGGCEVPDWGLGVLYRSWAKSTQEDVISLAEYFRDRQIPCDIIGLEPGWQTNTYSCSYQWDSERFPKHREMIKRLKEMNFHINLWEHAFVHCTSPIYDKLLDKSGDYEVWKGIIPDFADSRARDVFAKYHKSALIDEGIDGFKLDECDSSDYVHDWSFPNCTSFPSGIDGEQFHCLFGTLYMQTIMTALGSVQTFSEVRNAGALAANYPFVLYSDLYDHKIFIRGVVNSGFSGLLWSPEVRHAKSRKDFIRRLETTVFSVQCVINAWYCKEAPWIEWDCEDEVRELLEVRKSLIPRLRKAFRLYHECGIPPVRALVADFTHDKETHNTDDEYIFCDLIVAPQTEDEDEREVYLPEGKWRNFWTGERQTAGRFVYKGKRIAVFEREKL